MFICGVLAILSASPFLSTAQSPGSNCTHTSFRCDDGICVDAKLKCNGAIDCPDASDEDFVLCRTKKCQKSEFQCVYGACVPGNATCNGVQDCADRSDELLLKCRNETTYEDCLSNIDYSKSLIEIITLKLECTRKENTCKNGQTGQGIEKCNGIVDCDDGSDETLETCASYNCGRRKNMFRCKYGACIFKYFKCTGFDDCVDGSDELKHLCHTNKKKLCTLPPFPKNGYYSASNGHNVYPGQTLQSVHINYSCHPGYKLVGESSRDCHTGWWNSDPPKCLSQCPLKKNPSVKYLCFSKDSNSLVRFKECDKLVEDGTTVRPQCRSPNYYNSAVLLNMHCINGTWDYVALCSPQCGRVTADGDGLVLGGRHARRGELPWHAGIYKKTFDPYKQICGGSLISTTVVISAAHCFWSEVQKQLPASNFAVAVGKLYRPWANPHDEGAQRSYVREIKIPEHFQGAAANFQDDIALVIVMTPFIFLSHVRPVCVDFDTNFERRQLHEGAIGKVAGWGLTAVEGVEAQTLHVVDMPFVATETCFNGSPLNFQEFITSDKICAGYNNGTARTVCRGDSGGGLAFLGVERGAERYFLRGVASTAPTDENINHLCNPNVYATFTLLSKHEDFIKVYLS